MKGAKAPDRFHDGLVLSDEFTAAFDLKALDSLGIARSRKAEICMQRAEALILSCRFSEAYNSLKSFGYFSLPEEIRSRLCISRLKACFLAGDMQVFGSEIQEALSAGLLPDKIASAIEYYLTTQNPRQRSEEIASALSTIPGLGKYYAGDWIGAMGDNLCAAALIYGGLYTALHCKTYFSGVSIFGTLYYSLLESSVASSGECTAKNNARDLMDYYTEIYLLLE